MASETQPAFQFYPKDFLTSTKVKLMSMTERGIYITLLAHCWLEGGVPANMRALARLCSMPEARFTRMWLNGPLSACFYEHNGLFVNDRLENERSLRMAYVSRQSANGALGGRPKKNPLVSETKPKGNGNGDGDLDHLLEEKKRDADFGAFWQAYPRKDGKQAARVEWLRLKPTDEQQRQMAADLERRCQSSQWMKDGGQFIPHARTYLHQRRWEDGFEERPRLAEKTINIIKGFEEPKAGMA